MAPRKEPCSGGNARPAQPARPSLPAPGAQASRVPSPGHKRDGGVTPARAQALVDGSAEKGGPILPAGGYESLKSPKSMHGGAVTAIKIQPSTGLLYTGGADRLVKVRAPPRPACSPAPRPATPELRPRRREQVWDVFNSEKPPACPPRPPRLPPRPPRFTPRAAGRDARAGRCRCVHAFRAHGGSVTCLEFGCVGPSPGFLFTGGTDSAVVVWKDAEGARPPPPPPPSRTDWTRLVPPPVLTGHVSSLLPY